MKWFFFGDGIPPVKKKVGKAKRKAPDSIRFPEEVKAFFKKDGPGWQKRINAVLLDYVQGHRE